MMETLLRRWMWIALTLALLVTSHDLFALGSDHPNDRPISGMTNWPGGLEKLVNTANRVHGFFVNASDVFFFSGSASNLTSFLQDYSHIEGIESHCLILHGGRGEAKSPWDKSGRPCEWKLNASQKGWHNLMTAPRGTNSTADLIKIAHEPGYIVEVHFWTNGPIPLDQVVIPKNVEVRKAK